MNVTALFYTPTGQIDSMMTGDEDSVAADPAPKLIIDNPDGKVDWHLTHYVDVVNEVLLELQPLAAAATWSATTLAANGTSTITLGPGLPVGTRVLVDAGVIAQANGAPTTQMIEVDDGSFVFATDIAGTYTIRTENSAPYLNTATEITAS